MDAEKAGKHLPRSFEGEGGDDEEKAHHGNDERQCKTGGFAPEDRKRLQEAEGVEDARDEEADEAAGESHVVEAVALMKTEERAGDRRKDEADSDSRDNSQRDADHGGQADFKAEIGDNRSDRRAEESDDRVGTEAHLGELAGEKDTDDDGSRVVEGVAEEGEAHHRHDRRQRRTG